MVLLLGALLIPMVGCGMHQNLVGPDTASLGSGPDVQDDGASKNPARRAPIEDPIVYAPEGLHIDDASWAWTVGWNSTNQDVTYQLFEYTGNGWTLMAQTRATLPQAWVGLGISYEQLGKRPEAAEAFRRSLAAGELSAELKTFAEQRIRALR